MRWSRVYFVANTLGLKYKLKEKQLGEHAAIYYCNILKTELKKIKTGKTGK